MKNRKIKEAEAEVLRLDKAIKEYTKSWDTLLEAKDKEVQKAKDQLAALQAPILKSPLYMSVMQCICQGTDF